MARHVRVARHLRGALRGWQPQRNTHTSAGGNRGEWWAGCPTDVTHCAGLPPSLAILAALIAGALGQQEECDVLGKSEAVDKVESPRHAGACACPGRLVGRAAGVWGRVQGYADMYPQGCIHINQRIRRPVACSRAATYLGMAQLCMLL